MVDLSDYEPKNPLNIDLPLEGTWPGTDWNLAKTAKDETLADVDPIRAGIYAWGIYGVLCVTNYLYYGDRFYYYYTVSPFSAGASYSFRSIWGVLSWVRDFSLWLTWSFTALSWALSAFGNMYLIKIFSYMTTILVNWTMFRVVMQVLVGVAGVWIDNYSHDLNVYNYWDEKVWGFANRQVPGEAFDDETSKAYYNMTDSRNRDMPEDFAFIDFLLEGVNIAIQLVAYPMLQLGVSEGLRKWDQMPKAVKEK